MLLFRRRNLSGLSSPCMVLLMSLSLCACGSKEPTEDEESSQEASEENSEEESEENSEEDSKEDDKDGSEDEESEGSKEASEEDAESEEPSVPEPEDDELPGSTGQGPDQGTGTQGDGGKDSTGDPKDTDPTDYCKGVTEWDPAWTKLEDEILEQVNAFRAKGADCKSAGKFEPAGPVTLDVKLRCAARVHSKDMGDRNFFDHMNPDQESPFARMKKAGFVGRTAGENIAAGNQASKATMDQWIGSDGHCSNMMNPAFTKLGVGYYPKPGSTYRHYWTQNFGG